MMNSLPANRFCVEILEDFIQGKPLKSRYLLIPYDAKHLRESPEVFCICLFPDQYLLDFRNIEDMMIIAGIMQHIQCFIQEAARL